MKIKVKFKDFDGKEKNNGTRNGMNNNLKKFKIYAIIYV